MTGTQGKETGWTDFKTMEIVINKRLNGSFGLSPLAAKQIAERKGTDVFFYKRMKSADKEGVSEYARISLEQAEFGLFVHTTIKDLGAVTANIPYSAYFYQHQIERNDSDLVEVVRRLGADANALDAELKIIEIPDGIDYEILKQDGRELVVEKLRTWC